GALPLFVALGCAGLAVYSYAKLDPGHGIASAHRLGKAGVSLLLTSLALALLVGVGTALRLHRRHWPPTLNFATVFAVPALALYALAPLSGVLAGATHSEPHTETTPAGYFTGAANVVPTHGGHGATAYTLLTPRGWAHESTPSGLQIWTDYALPGGHPGAPTTPMERIGVFTSSPSVSNPAQLVALNGAVRGTARRDGSWSVVDLTTGNLHGMMWARPAPHAFNTSYFLEGLVRGVPLETARPEL